jgi:thymidylate synthase (FAD)
MKIVKPYMRMLTTGVVNTLDGAHLDALKHIDWCGRISHRSEDAPSDTLRFLQAVVIGKGDWSIVEHSSVSVDAIVDRGITHEIVRHRIASYTQESTRFVNYVKKMPASFIYPVVGVDCVECLDGYEPAKFPDGWFHGTGRFQRKCMYDRLWMDQIQSAEDSYKSLVDKGWRPQEARSVFPNALSSRIVITMNLRTWRHFFLMRTSKEAHPQMRQVTIPLLKEFQAAIPVLYDDISPDARQVDNIKLGS